MRAGRPLARKMNGKSAGAGRTGLARALSKLGLCSRSQAWALIEAGRVRVNGVIERDPQRRLEVGTDRIELDGQKVRALAKIYLMLNKPRGLVTTASDEQGRETVFACLKDSGLPFVAPVGRLDKASEGLLLLTNDTQWAARITDPASRLEKIYHVQIDAVADAALLDRLRAGASSEGEWLGVERVELLRSGNRNSWLEIALCEGKNRHLRRLLAALGVGVLRLIRVRIGELKLGDLPKGRFRHLDAAEARAMAKC